MRNHNRKDGELLENPVSKQGNQQPSFTSNGLEGPTTRG